MIRARPLYTSPEQPIILAATARGGCRVGRDLQVLLISTGAKHEVDTNSRASCPLILVPLATDALTACNNRSRPD